MFRGTKSTSSSEKLSAYLKILNRLEYGGGRLPMKQVLKADKEGSDILVSTTEEYCSVCGKIFGHDCIRKGHLEHREVECGSLALNWLDLFYNEIGIELEDQGFKPIEDGTFTKQNLRVGIEPHIGSFFRADLNSVFAKAVRLARWDACLVLGREKRDDVKAVENYYPEIFFCHLKDFSNPRFRHGSLRYLEGLARSNKRIRQSQVGGGEAIVEKVRPTTDMSLTQIIEATEEIILEITRRGKSDLKLGNLFDQLMKQLCGDLFFQYTIHQRGNLPDFLVFSPGSLRYFVVDAKSGSLDIKERRKVRDYALTQKRLKTGDLDLSMAGLLVIARAPNKKEARDFCTKTKTMLLENRRVPKDIVVSWLCPNGLLELARSVRGNINLKFFINLFLSDVLRQGYIGEDEMKDALRNLQERRISGHSNRDAILGALRENVDYYNPT